jgi:hypothetical protein
MFARHHQPPPSGVISAKIAQPVGISASSAGIPAANGSCPLMASTIAMAANVRRMRVRITGISATSVAAYSPRVGIEGSRHVHSSSSIWVMSVSLV